MSDQENWEKNLNLGEASGSKAKANLFKVADGWVVPVTMGPKEGIVNVAICNVPESSLVREAAMSLMTRAGPEIGVASTKAFTGQVAVLTLLTLALGRVREMSADAGIQLARRIFSDFERHTALLVGAGDMIELAARHLHATAWPDSGDGGAVSEHGVRGEPAAIAHVDHRDVGDGDGVVEVGDDQVGRELLGQLEDRVVAVCDVDVVAGGADHQGVPALPVGDPDQGDPLRRYSHLLRTGRLY